MKGKKSKQNCPSLFCKSQSELVQLVRYVLSHYFASDLVRHSAARVIASIASNEFSHATWPQLLPYLLQTCMSSDVKHREVGIYIIFTVLEAIAEGFEDHMAEF